jgi:hypothetical protein
MMASRSRSTSPETLTARSACRMNPRSKLLRRKIWG